MMRILGRLTYANVMATVAVFIALGGASYAAIKLPKNSVGAKQLKKGSVTEAKIKDGAISGRKLAKGAIGTVPAATHATSADHAASADNATTLGGQTAAQLAAASKLRCPAGTELAAGYCIETTARPATTFTDAVTKCAEAGRELPSESVLLATLFPRRAEGVLTSPEWTSEEISTSEARTLRVDNFGGGPVFNFSPRRDNEPAAFRCVTLPAN